MSKYHKNQVSEWDFIRRFGKKTKWKIHPAIRMLYCNNAVASIDLIRKPTFMNEMYNSKTKEQAVELSGSTPNTQFFQKQYHYEWCGTIQMFDGSMTRLGKRCHSDVLYSVLHHCKKHGIPVPGSIRVSNTPINSEFVNPSYRYLLVKLKNVNDNPNSDQVSMHYDNGNNITHNIFFPEPKNSFTSLKVTNSDEFAEALEFQGQINERLFKQHQYNKKCMDLIHKKLAPLIDDYAKSAKKRRVKILREKMERIFDKYDKIMNKSR